MGVKESLRRVQQVRVKGCSKIDSIVLGQHAVRKNLEESKGNGCACVMKRRRNLSAEGDVHPTCRPVRPWHMFTTGFTVRERISYNNVALV